MSVILGLLFHGNFPFSMHYPVAYHSCYKHLPIIMGEFPDIPVNWHLSATLLQQMAWKNPETIEHFREGLNNNQFELLGSSYAQNILYTCSEWINRKQIKWNHIIIHNLFPKLKKLNGYWNAERVFYEEMISMLLEYGYNYTLVENDILKGALRSNNLPVEHVWKRKIKSKNTDFFYLPDNQIIKEKINRVIQSGQTTEFINFLNRITESDSDKQVLCYAEDAEVIGFWQIARNMDYKKSHENLKLFFKELTDNSWIEVKLFSDIIRHEKSFEIDKIPNGQASWMVESVNIDGYKDWFEYTEQSPEIKYYQEYYRSNENRFKSQSQKNKKRNLTIELLKYNLSQQFEFGCAPGSFGDFTSRYLMNVPGMQLWDDRTTIDTIFDWLSTEKAKTFKPIWKFRGSSPVIEWFLSKWICQFSPFGGRCTFLVNKDKDSIFSPNLFFSSQDRNVLFNALPHLKIHVNYPGIEEITNTHGNFLMDNCYVNNESIGSMMDYKVEINQNGRKYFQKKILKHTLFNSLILPKENSILFWYSEAGILIKKEIKEINSNINILYTIQNISEDIKTIMLAITNEFSPESIVVLENGVNSLKLEISEEKSEVEIIVINTITNSGVSLISKVHPNNIKKIPAEFALRYKIIYQFKLNKKEIKYIPLIVK
ncbi:MAG: hypothetical protein ACFFA3_06995 [Promethearchaeota archaeon]